MKKQSVSLISRSLSRIEVLSSWLNTSYTVPILLAMITIVALGKVLVLRHTTFFVNLDNVDQFYTWYQKLAVSWHHGYLPIWDANVFSGQSFAGEMQPGVFYPINWLWVALFGSVNGISETALNWLVALHFWLGALGFYLLARQLSIRKWAAVLVGVLFVFSGTVVFRSISQTVIFFGLCLLPYPAYFLYRFHHAAQKRWLVASGASLGLLLLVGHIDPFLFALMLLGLIELNLAIPRYKRLRDAAELSWHAIKRLFVIGAVAVAVALPQLLVSLPYLEHSYRVQATGYSGPTQKISYGQYAKSFSLNIHEFANLIDPQTYPISDGNNLFIGLAPLAILLIVTCLAWANLRKQEGWKQNAFLVMTLLIGSTVIMLGYLTWIAYMLYQLPVVYEIRQLGRYSVFFDMALLLLFAFALQAAVQWRPTKRQRNYLVVIGGFMAVESLYLFAGRNHGFSLHFILQVALLAATILCLVLLSQQAERRVAFVVLILATVFVNTLWYLPKLTSTTETALWYTAMPVPLAQVLEQNNGRYRLEVKNNAIPVNIGNVYHVQTIGGYGATISAPFYEFMNKSGLPMDFRDDLLGVQLVADTTAPAGVTTLYRDRYVSVYERSTALPKFFVTDHKGSINRADYHGLNVTTLHYDDQVQSFRVQVPKAEQVILSELAYPGWKATVDGREVPIATYAIGNYPLLKSLTLSAGTHTVVLTYKPFGLF